MLGYPQQFKMIDCVGNIRQGNLLFVRFSNIKILVEVDVFLCEGKIPYSYLRLFLLNISPRCVQMR